ncbi:uncharacterized protein LOC117647148 [Thrips palmi]|uniref:Uncharacterized protein LOC117647148 n=1 Tax=Thrips palmi TaxID=161013 RepID=A0A6P8Z4B7_THRPL|nr:uncharacterized protein LOC117647148 [Thrips palmi]
MASRVRCSTPCSTPRVLLLLLGVAAAAVLAAEDDPAEANRFSRLATYVRSYVTKQGINMMVSDDDIKCLLEAGRALRTDSTVPVAKPIVSLYNLVMRTTPRCKLSLLAKSRMFLSADFAKNTMGILLNMDATTTEHP